MGRQCLRWVKNGKPQNEHKFSGPPPKADPRFVRSASTACPLFGQREARFAVRSARARAIAEIRAEQTDYLERSTRALTVELQDEGRVGRATLMTPSPPSRRSRTRCAISMKTCDEARERRAKSFSSFIDFAQRSPPVRPPRRPCSNSGQTAPTHGRRLWPRMRHGLRSTSAASKS
jgi:hypothetical protein